MRNRKISGIDTLREREKMVKFLLERLEFLRKKESECGEPLVETRETISTLNAVLTQLRVESSGLSEFDREHLFEETFGDWLAKVEANKKVKKESEGTE